MHTILFQTAVATILGVGERELNIQLKECDSILVGNSKQGICVSCNYVPIQFENKREWPYRPTSEAKSGLRFGISDLNYLHMVCIPVDIVP